MSTSAIFQNLVKVNPFPATSRYFGIETATREMQNGETAVYVRRRFVPSPDRFETLLEHTVRQHERLDNITAKYFGDPEQFWRVCDANNAMQPDELTERIGRKIRITLPEGIPSQPNA